MQLNFAISALLMILPMAVEANCFEEAGQKYSLPAEVLRAVAKTESGFNARAVNVNTNGSRDLGLMQINTSWLSTLKNHGITERDLYQPCTNVMIGAWILANNAQRHGWNWNAIGAYNVGCRGLTKADCASRRDRYARKVHRSLVQVSNKQKPVAPMASVTPTSGIVVHQMESAGES